MEYTYWVQVVAMAVVLYMVFFLRNRRGERTRLQRSPRIVQAGLAGIGLALWCVVPNKWVGRVMMETYPARFWVAPLVLWLALCAGLVLRRVDAT